MSDITEFLLARIAEDEETARFAQGPWRLVGPSDCGCCVRVVEKSEALLGDLDIPHADHILRHDPARVLAECEAKRHIVAEHPDYGDYGESCATCAESDIDLTPWPCPTMRALATVYADHPDYAEAWRA